MVFLPMAQAPPQADAKELFFIQSTVYRLNLIHEFTPFFSKKVIFAGMPKKTFPRKQAFVDRDQGPRFSQGQPKGYCQMKDLDRTAEAFARMNAV